MPWAFIVGSSIPAFASEGDITFIILDSERDFPLLQSETLSLSWKGVSQFTSLTTVDV